VKSERDYALTDSKGRFGLTDVKAMDTLHVSLKKHTWAIPVSGRKSLRICLAGTGVVKQADEDGQLVDLGFGFVSRREHTGGSNFIGGDELRRSGQNDVLSALQGRVPGLSITGLGSMGNQQQVNMRGERSFTADSTPLYLIDTVVVPSFEGLSLNDVDYVEIMKEASVYGSQGANGAIIVHTKTAAK
jgi:outer membrane receptor for ferrienterochelin and colicin